MCNGNVCIAALKKKKKKGKQQCNQVANLLFTKAICKTFPSFSKVLNPDLKSIVTDLLSAAITTHQLLFCFFE